MISVDTLLIMSVRHRGPLLEQTLESLAAQTCRDFSIIVLCPESTKPFDPSSGHPVRYLSYRTILEHSRQLRNVLTESHAEFVGFPEPGTVYPVSWLEESVVFLQKNLDCSSVGQTENHLFSNPQLLKWNLLADGRLPQSIFLWRIADLAPHLSPEDDGSPLPIASLLYRSLFLQSVSLVPVKGPIRPARDDWMAREAPATAAVRLQVLRRMGCPLADPELKLLQGLVTPRLVLNDVRLSELGRVIQKALSWMEKLVSVSSRGLKKTVGEQYLQCFRQALRHQARNNGPIVPFLLLMPPPLLFNPLERVSLACRVLLRLLDRPLLAFAGLLGVLAGRLEFRCRPNPGGIFFFFHGFNLGGAERVHAEIVAGFDRDRPVLYLSSTNPDQRFRSLYRGGFRLIDLTIKLKKGWLSAFWIGRAAAFINAHPRPVVFGCCSHFFYRLLPRLTSSVRKIDLIHAFDGYWEQVSAESIRKLDARVVINDRTRMDYELQYQGLGVENEYLRRIQLIENCTYIPNPLPAKPFVPPLNVVYIGRATPEKRVDLAGAVAELSHRKGLPCTFEFIGDVESQLSARYAPFIKLTSAITDAGELRNRLIRSHVLLLVSSREGFPLVVMEAMAFGVIPLCTAVGGIPDHLIDGDNGLLIRETEEEGIVLEAVSRLESLLGSAVLRERLMSGARRHAEMRFSGERFIRQYRQLLLGKA